mmetsp:Transcript_802/g.2621  ORF Transcript_802/g.2621 Transcript_802/m.2621 type:complete len:164 (-) Transcript_802:1972-2463(-)
MSTREACNSERMKNGKKTDLSITIPENTQTIVVHGTGGIKAGNQQSCVEYSSSECMHNEGVTRDHLSTLKNKRPVVDAGLPGIPSPSELNSLVQLGSPDTQLADGNSLPTPGFLAGIEWPSPKSAPSARGTAGPHNVDGPTISGNIVLVTDNQRVTVCKKQRT